MNRSLRGSAFARWVPSCLATTLVGVTLACSTSSGSPQAEGGPDTSSAPLDDSGMSDSSNASSGSGNDGSPGVLPDDGPSHCNGGTLAAGQKCPTKKPTTTTLLGTTFAGSGNGLTYGSSPDVWDVYSFASDGETAPTVMPSAGSIAVSATLMGVSAMSAVGVGISVDGANCVDETNFARGLVFNLSGDLGGCSLFVDAVTSSDESSTEDPCRGTCNASSSLCVANTFQVSAPGMINVPNMSFQGGSPAQADSSQLIGFRWRLTASNGGSCTASLTISGVQLLGI